jgi:hypothetical protein
MIVLLKILSLKSDTNYAAAGGEWLGFDLEFSFIIGPFNS